MLPRLSAFTLSVAMALVLACDRNPPAPRSASAKPTDPTRPQALTAVQESQLSPIETIELLRSFRSARRFSKLDRFLPIQHATAVRAQLKTTDRLVAAAKVLRQRVESKYGKVASEQFQYAHLPNIVGVFSRDVTLLSQEIDGRHASVTYQVADRVPLESVELERRDDRWILRVDPIDGVPETLFRLARLLERMSRIVDQRDLTIEQLRDDIEIRQIPILRKLDQLVNRADKP
jgi:hypothetical protein